MHPTVSNTYPHSLPALPDPYLSYSILHLDACLPIRRSIICPPVTCGSRAQARDSTTVRAPQPCALWPLASFACCFPPSLLVAPPVSTLGSPSPVKRSKHCPSHQQHAVLSASSAAASGMCPRGLLRCSGRRGALGTAGADGTGAKGRAPTTALSPGARGTSPVAESTNAQGGPPLPDSPHRRRCRRCPPPPPTSTAALCRASSWCSASPEVDPSQNSPSCPPPPPA